MRNMPKSALPLLGLSALLLSACAGVPDAPARVVESTGPVKTDAAITNTLVDLLENKDRYVVSLTNVAGTPVNEILSLGSPIGYTLRNRYLNIGIPIAEALSRDNDPIFREKLVTVARWDRNNETRSSAQIALARKKELRDLAIFNEALVHLDPGVRFGALEALQNWGHPDRAKPYLDAASLKDYEPILRVYAAAGLARLGDFLGVIRLREFIDNPSWLVKGMAMRYLGDYGNANDYELLKSRIGVNMTNDFVVAEACIAALKLWPKKLADEDAKRKTEEKTSTAPPAAPRGNIPDSFDGGFSLEPLTITAPRSKVTRVSIDPQINSQLLRLLQQRQDARPDSLAASDASIINLGKLSTLTGYNLKTRYTELSFLLTEGLAGTREFDLISELEKTTRFGKNVQARAAAMVALAYTHDLRYLPLFQNALLDQNITVRFGALESLLILGDPSTQFQIGNAARTDQSPVIQIYAAAGLWQMGDIFGREILLKYYQNEDWFLRAMAVHYLGELGGADEYRRLLIQLTRETHPSAKAELVSALLRLQRFKEED
jgi:HEAT repeat protein